MIPCARIHARMRICAQGITKGAPIDEQKELRKQRKAAQLRFANGAVNCGKKLVTLTPRSVPSRRIPANGSSVSDYRSETRKHNAQFQESGLSYRSYSKTRSPHPAFPLLPLPSDNSQGSDKSVSSCPPVCPLCSLQPAIFLRHRFTAFSSLSICCIHRTVGIDFKI